MSHSSRGYIKNNNLETNAINIPYQNEYGYFNSLEEMQKKTGRISTAVSYDGGRTWTPVLDMDHWQKHETRACEILTNKSTNKNQSWYKRFINWLFN